MKKIAKENLPKLFAEVSAAMDLFTPVKMADVTNWGLWDDSRVADLDTSKTVKSPKDVFFPQCQTLYMVHHDDNGFEISPMKLTEKPFCVFGIRPCDVKALTVMDQVFLNQEPVDTFYKARREHAVLVSLACHKPAQTCFCKVFGTDAAAPDADVAMWKIDEFFYLEAQTEKGTAWLDQFAGAFEDAEDAGDKIAKEQDSIRSIVESLPYTHLSLEGWGPGKVEEKFNDPHWKELSDACLACGTCTFVCPTCQCYDIKDFNTGHGIQRYRCWDSCMYSDFTLMAAANNRLTQMQRYRQRFMHKLVYFPENNNGLYMCVGCGRCVDKCPQALNIVKVIKTMGKENADV